MVDLVGFTIENAFIFHIRTALKLQELRKIMFLLILYCIVGCFLAFSSGLYCDCVVLVSYSSTGPNVFKFLVAVGCSNVTNYIALKTAKSDFSETLVRTREQQNSCNILIPV